VEYRGYDAPRAAEIKDSASTEIDIKHGNGAFFVIGRIVSGNNIGVFKGSVTIDDNSLKSFEHNDTLGAVSFHVSGGSGNFHFALGTLPDTPSRWILIAVISAEDKKSRMVRLNIDARDKRHPVTFAKDENG